MCELARALFNRSQLMNIATFSTQDFRERGCKSYVAGYWSNKQLVIPWMFSHKLLQWRWFAKVFFRRRFPIYGKYDILTVIFVNMQYHVATQLLLSILIRRNNDHGILWWVIVMTSFAMFMHESEQVDVLVGASLNKPHIYVMYVNSVCLMVRTFIRR